jgi:hypothetical protein
MAKFFIQPSYTCNEINLNSALEEGLFQVAISEGIREDPVHRQDQAEGSEEELTTEKKKIIEKRKDNCA